MGFRKQISISKMMSALTTTGVAPKAMTGAAAAAAARLCTSLLLLLFVLRTGCMASGTDLWLHKDDQFPNLCFDRFVCVCD
jgi:hypothetical protein